MYLTHLSLTNFRNYARLELELPPTAVLIVGDNAQGKSNLLEAIFFLATTKSFRANSDRELINWLALSDESPFARLAARIQKEHSTLRVEIAIKEDGKRSSGENGTITPIISKRVKINNIVRRAIDLIGQINVVMFSPQDIDIVGGPPQLRRRYLDVTISQVDARYCRTLAHYNKVLMQRNHLLRQIREKRAKPDQLFFWNQELASAGAYIVLQRLETVTALNALVFGIHRRLTGSQELLRIVPKLSLEGEPCEALCSGAPKSTAEARMAALAAAIQEQLTRYQQRELTYGASLIGPHRDDLMFLVDEKDMNIYGSRGQQRTVALSLKLAEMDFMRNKTGEEPILLLDDVASELDAQRRHHVLEAVRTHQQILLTASDPNAFESHLLAEALVLRVENGAICVA